MESKTVGRAVGRKPRFISLRRLLKKDTPEVRENLEANEFEDEARIEHQNVCVSRIIKDNMLSIFDFRHLYS